MAAPDGGEHVDEGDILSREEWGRHLRADYIHDEISDPNIPFNIGGLAAKRTPTADFDRNAYWTRVMTLENVRGNVEFQNRMARKIELTLPTITGTYDAVPTPISDLGNNAVGVVTDAGKFVTHYLGAMNVITFGTCLDPAPSAVGGNRMPIFFDASGASLSVDMGQFGFDPAMLRTVTISEFTGRSVKTLWDASGGVIDPVKQTRYAVGQDISAKEINKPMGYYQSRGTVLAKYQTHDPNADFYGMGKTMGDVLLVASAMSNVIPPIAGGGAAAPATVPNPFYGIGREGWRRLNRAGNIPGPQIIAFKTGDILNAVRSIFKKVPTILEKQATATQPKKFDFYPTTVDDVEMRASVPRLYERLINGVTARYTQLIAQYQGIVVGGEYSSDCTRFSEGPNGRVDLDDDQRRIAADIVNRIVNKLTELNEQVNAHLRAKRAEIVTQIATPTVTTANILRQYSLDSESASALSPQTKSPIRYRGGDGAGARIFMRLVVPVVRTTVPTNGGSIASCEIHLFSALKAVKDRGDDYQSSPYWAAFIERFPIPVAGGARLGSDHAVKKGGASESLLTSYSSIFSLEEFALRLPDKVKAIDGDRVLERSEIIPVTSAFIEYIRPKIGTSDISTILTMIYGLLLVFEIPERAGYLVDYGILIEIDAEYRWMIEWGVLRIVKENTKFDQRYISLYNAFTFHINHNNATMDRDGRDDAGFDVVEQALLATVRPRAAVAPAPPPAPALGAAPAAAGAGEPPFVYTGASPSRSSERGDPSTLSPGQRYRSSTDTTPAVSPVGKKQKGRRGQAVEKALGVIFETEAAAPAPEPAPAPAPAPAPRQSPRTGTRKRMFGRLQGGRRTYRLKKKPTK